jgi:hypothetical protein
VAQSPFCIRRSTHASRRDGRLWRTFFALASLVWSLPAAAAQEEAEPPLRYRVEVSAPSEIKGAVERSLTLTRWQTYPDPPIIAKTPSLGRRSRLPRGVLLSCG